MPFLPDPTATLPLPMPETAPPPVVAEQTAPDDDVVSPELVLVDPTLRDRLAALPPPAPFVAPRPAPDEPAIEEPAPEPSPGLMAPPPPIAPLLVAEPVQPEPAPAAAPAEKRRRRRWPVVLAALAGAALSAAATIVFLPQSKSAPETASVVLDPGTTGHVGTATSATPTPPQTAHHPKPKLSTTTATPPPRAQTTHATTTHTVTHPQTTAHKQTTPPKTKATHHPKPKPSTTPASPPPTSGGGTTREKLAWAPAPGAAAYEMDLLRGSKRIFHVRTKQTSLIITVRSGARGPAGSLPAGDYEWVVYPIVGGHKGQPTVRSRLTLPG